MRMSRLFSQTLREVPAEAELPSHRLLLKGPAWCGRWRRGFTAICRWRGGC
ncbi:MAG: hypothetical protein KatS3mg131_2610 [Candidatus Tectimicrobiota bacterium]|nr:MAG: hypothetical protein KatS3mg131_2610 [Candidatus Tectomicrobia bacterium]